MIVDMENYGSAANLEDVDAMGQDEEFAILVGAVPALEQAVTAHGMRRLAPMLEMMDDMREMLIY